MVGRLRERQYQLAAQRHNETYLKYNYYQQTAKYFERQCTTARHYDSWNFENTKSKEQLEKAKKAERLLIRRNKLRSLLKEEDEQYRKELDRSRAKKTQDAVPSLEALKERLKEKRVEQNLYLPQTCRRYQSYFVRPKDSSKSLWSNFRNGENQRPIPACRDSTNIIRPEHNDSPRNARSMSGIETLENQVSLERLHTSRQGQEEPARPSSKYSARYSRRSLENTNVRYEQERAGERQYTPSRKQRPIVSSASHGNRDRMAHFVMTSAQEHNEEYKMMSESKEERSSIVSGDDNSGDLKREETAETDKASDRLEESCSEKSDQLEEVSTLERTVNNLEIDEMDECQIRQESDRKDLQVQDHRQFESERSLPWMRMIPSDKNLSEEMFLYLTHVELKNKIDDLAKRELHACTKQSWDEALRLRDMRNRLDLIREKRLYNTAGLALDDDAKKLGWTNIEKREEELAKREFACTDSTMYSEEAKELWKQWVKEDDESVIKDARAQREILMKKLEQEWHGFATQDKDNITNAFRNVISGSWLQDEQKLTAELGKALSSPKK